MTSSQLLTLNSIDVKIGTSMTMANRESIPPFEPVNPEELLNEFEALQHSIELLHVTYDDAATTDAADAKHKSLMLDQVVQLETRTYLQLGVPSEHNPPMVCDWYQLALRPERGSIARAKVFEIIARFPYYTEKEQPVDLPPRADRDRWDDVSLEITFADSTSYRYWLNNKGLIPYKNAAGIDITFPRTHDETDLFTVLPEGVDHDARQLTASELKMILRGSKAKHQPNNPEDE